MKTNGISIKNSTDAAPLPSLAELIQPRSGTCLSFYLPLNHHGQDVRQAAILLKNLIAEARGVLEAQSSSIREMDELLAPVENFLETTDFFSLSGSGLALLSASDYFTSIGLPIAPSPAVAVDKRFRLDPMLPILLEEDHFFLLFLSVNSIRLWEGSRHTLLEVPLNGIPTTMDEALSREVPDSQSLFRTGGGPHGKTHPPAIYYGQSGGADAKRIKRDIEEFFQRIDAALQPLLAARNWPLILTGVDYLLPIYRDVNTYPKILKDSVPGNFESNNALKTLQEKALSCCQKARREERAKALSRYVENLATGLTTSGITDVLPSAYSGRVSHVFLRKGFSQWGEFNPDTGEVKLTGQRPGAEDMINLACLHTLKGKGVVYVMEAEEMPSGADISALCRY